MESHKATSDLKVRLERSGHPLALSMVLNLNEFMYLD